MYRHIFQTLEFISRELQLQFPDRKAQRLTFLDAGNFDGVCPNHGTHNGFPPTALDVQYYTLGESNCTQFGQPHTEIWNDDGALNRKVFDAERNAAYILLLAEAFPWLGTGNNYLMINSKVRSAIISAGKSIAEQAILKGASRDEDTPTYNHDRHMHLYFKKEINENAIL
jgi:hypothetical protein